jgi:Domain of unknown function (DUF4419)
LHAAVAGVHWAFDQHRRLVLSPDAIWMLIVQGFSHHVAAHAEALRSRFVRHEGKLELTVRRDDFVKGGRNPWHEVVEALSVQVREHIGDATHDLLVPTFSTTGPRERIAAAIALLDVNCAYFDYGLVTVCGIPEIELEGTPGDWRSLRDRALALGQFGLDWWVAPLAPILDEFVAAANGRVRRAFWQSMYKYDNECGGRYIDGWLLAFFPYLTDDDGILSRRSPFLGEARNQAVLGEIRRRRFGGLSTLCLPSGLSRASLRWEYYGQTLDLELVAGFLGARQRVEPMSVRPEIGWLVYEPARRDRLVAARRAAHEAEREAALRRAAQWTHRGMCPRCRFWQYSYEEGEKRFCCGVPLINLQDREGNRINLH